MTPESGSSDHRISAQARSRWTKACLALVVVKLLILVVLAFNTRLVMDEFWHLHQSFYLFNGFFTEIWPEKAVLYAVYFKLSAYLSWDAVSQILVARGLSAVLAIGLVAVVYATSRAAGHSRLAALAVALVLLSFSNFIERGFRLRSEPLAILLAATALWIVVRGPMDRMRTIAIAGILSGLAFVTTQKSVYFNVALGAGLVIDALSQRSVTVAVKRALALIGGWAAAVLAYVIVFGGWDAPALLRWTFVGPLEMATTGQTSYGNLRAYTGQTVQRNVILYMACFVGLAWQLRHFPALSPGARVHVVFTLVITLLVFTHNQPWPYVFTMAIPFLAFYAVPCFLSRGTTQGRRKLLLVLFAVALTLSFARNAYYLGHDNRRQLAVVRAAEAEVPPGSTYFDGTGLLPNRAMVPYLWLDALGVRKTLDAGDASPMMLGLRRTPPAVIIENYRIVGLSALLQPLVGQSYVQVGRNLRVPGIRLAPGEPQGFSVLSGAVFVARDDQANLISEIVIDGQIRTLPLRLEVGEYSLRTTRDDPVWIVPERLDPRLLTRNLKYRELFADVYE